MFNGIFIPPIKRGRASGPSPGKAALTGPGGHQAVQLRVVRKTVDKRHQGRTVFNQAASGVRIGDIAHLLLGDIQQMGQLLPVARRLVEHDDELGVTEHGAGLYGVQKILHILGNGGGVGVTLAELPPRGVEVMPNQAYVCAFGGMIPEASDTLI